jgi:hypothetical protein
MSWGHLLDDLAEDDIDPILASMDALHDAVVLLGSLLAVVGLVALWLLINL